MTASFLSAQSKAQTVPMLYTREAKRRAVREVLAMLKAALTEARSAK